MFLVVELENVLIFKENTLNKASNSEKVYVDLNDDINENLGVINSNALDILKRYTKTNDIVFISNKSKKEFDNIYLSIHNVKYNKLILGFGYELYINNKLDIDWTVRVMHFKDENIKDITLIDNTMEDYFNGYYENMSYGYRISKGNLLNVREVFKEHKSLKIYDDESYYYIVYDLFDMLDILDYLIKKYNLSNEIVCVAGSSDYMNKSLRKAGNYGIYNCLSLEDMDYIKLVLRGVSIVSGNTHIVGEFVMDKVTEILVNSYFNH